MYVDGSEKRGAIAATIRVKYGSLTGQAFLTLWMAEWPLKVEVDDARLSLIRDWRVARSQDDEGVDDAQDDGDYEEASPSGTKG